MITNVNLHQLYVVLFQRNDSIIKLDEEYEPALQWTFINKQNRNPGKQLLKGQFSYLMCAVCNICKFILRNITNTNPQNSGMENSNNSSTCPDRPFCLVSVSPSSLLLSHSNVSVLPSSHLSHFHSQTPSQKLLLLTEVSPY